MQVSSINSMAAFKARVESASPLVNGDWMFIQDKPVQPASVAPKKKSHWLRNTLIAVGTVIAATAAFVGLRNTHAIKTVMNAGGFGAQESFGKKALWCVGKVGDGAVWLKNATWGNLVKGWNKLFKKAPAAEVPAPPAPPAPPATGAAEAAAEAVGDAAGNVGASI